MKIKKFLPFKNVIVVDDAETIRALSSDAKIDRQFKLHYLLNRFVIKHALRNLSYKGVRFPHMLPRQNAVRLTRHTELWNLFNAKAAAMAAGAGELDPLAKWIRHDAQEQEPGILVQQVLGQFFNPAFKANTESWNAALILHEDAVSTNLLKMMWWKLSGKTRNAKKLLAATVDNDIVAMHAIGVALHNLVASVHKLRSLYDDAAIRKNLTPEEAVNASLSAPPVVLRQALAEGVVGGCPFSRFTLFMLRLKDANRDNGAKDLIFMSDSWSRCPAEQWIPAVIAGIWRRVMIEDSMIPAGVLQR